MATNEDTPSNTRVLVVDEIPAVIRLLKLELTSEGFEVAGVEMEERPLEMVAEWQPHLILLEIVLPTISGFELLEQLRARFPDIPVVILTTQDTEQDRAYAFELGAADFISKPFDPQHLSARLKAVLQMKDTGPTVVRVAELDIDVSRLQVRRNRIAVSLMSIEWAIVLALLNAEGRVMSVAELAEQALGPGFEDRIDHVMAWVHRIREKLEDDPDDPRIIDGDPERGFRLVRSP